ncbi:MAG: SUMF1/EgtB/PvdO family nonheme iron enzyme [Acidimicrobiales bacterium]
MTAAHDPARPAFTVATVDPAEPEADLARSGPALIALRPELAALAAAGLDELLAVLADPVQPAARRHAAGLRLGELGDPRIGAGGPPGREPGTPMIPELVDIPAGISRMGIDLDEVDRVVARWASLGVERSWILKEAPRHEVAVAAFRIGRFPVTNEEFLAYVLATAPAQRPSAWGHGTFPLGAANQPVYTVSPEEASRYCAWLAEATGRPFRLPTEAEWEYAATGGDGRRYPWGDEWDPARANTAEAGPLTTTPVGIHPNGASPFGVLDLAGNVEEFVADDYRPYPGAETVDDDLTATHGAAYRVARGGSFARHGDLARCARRHGWYPSAHYAMGFRLVESVNTAATP